MKKIITLALSLVLFLAFHGCDDPYKNSTFQAYDLNPASSYMSSRSDLSEFVKVLEYADLYNAINQAYGSFTVFAPNNDAMKRFYESKNVSSMEELGVEYAQSFVKFHVLSDSVAYSTFIQGDELSVPTLSNDKLTVSFGADGGTNSVYLEGTAHVIEMNTRVSNGFIYVLEDALRPLVESIDQRLEEDKVNHYTILKEALKATGWADTLSVIKDTLKSSFGYNTVRYRNFTLLAVTDEVFAQSGINSMSDLVQKLGAGSDYTNAANELNRYMGYHILEGSYSLEQLQKAETDTVGDYDIRSTRTAGTVIKVSKEADGTYLNYENTGLGASFVQASSDVKAKNGYIHQITSYLPEWLPKPSHINFDFCDYAEVASYIEKNGTEGQKFQQSSADGQFRTEITSLTTYQYEIVNRPASTSSYNEIDYFTIRPTDVWKCLYNDQFILNLGYMSWVAMKTPTIIQGKYKVILHFCYATSMDFIRTADSSQKSNGGKMQFSFDGQHVIQCTPYTTVPTNKLDAYSYELYSEIEFDTTSDHTLKIVIMDPAASSNEKFRIQLDYLEFQPLDE